MKESEKLNLIEVGKRVREAREAKKLSGEELGALIHRSQNAISKIERGQTAKVNIDNIRLIARECNVSEDYLLLRSDYKTRREEIIATVGKMQELDAMWRSFIEYIALCSGYEMKHYEGSCHSNGDVRAFDVEELEKPYILFENESGSFGFSLRDANVFMDDITRYSELRLNMMIERKQRGQ